ncbi:MAG TPA: hypothetical protein VIQ05_13440 [Tardiphaga sp.]
MEPSKTVEASTPKNSGISFSPMPTSLRTATTIGLASVYESNIRARKIFLVNNIVAAAQHACSASAAEERMSAILPGCEAASHLTTDVAPSDDARCGTRIEDVPRI